MTFTMRLHHVALASPRAAEAATFYVDTWGLREIARDDHSIRLGTVTESPDDYSLMLVPAEEKFVHHFCLATDDEADVEAVRERLRAGGVRILDDAPVSPGLTTSVTFVDIDGRRVEIGYPPHQVADEPASAAEVPDAVPLKLGHIVLNTPDIVSSVAWYEEKVGLGVRDWREKKMAFLYCNRDHHTVAFNAAPHTSLNHVAYELADINHFFRAIGRATTDVEVNRKLHGPGRHGPGDYIFC
jgi:catechol 2,3-dioxygenase-like lactoylglutathione lyase family enzyme